uniref:Uncharacterized protein n=1 Tax=Glossina morsitans morsitans TaxID=37546 RepID=A0A1B0FPU3_GLOMM
MRAHFASDVPLSSDTDDDDVRESSSQDNARTHDALKTRIMKFKSDSSNMVVVCEFIDDVLQKAEEEAASRQQIAKNCKNSQQKNQLNKEDSTDFNGKMGNLARVFVVRVFDAICNCANNAAAAPIPRFKFRSGKRASSSGTSSNEKSDIVGGKSEKLGKLKKTDLDKDKKSEKVKFKAGNDKDFNVQVLKIIINEIDGGGGGDGSGGGGE